MLNHVNWVFFESSAIKGRVSWGFLTFLGQNVGEIYTLIKKKHLLFIVHGMPAGMFLKHNKENVNRFS